MLGLVDVLLFLGIALFFTVLTAPLSGHQVMINGHALCPPLFFVCGCDPCRPGPAVQVGAPAAK